MGKNISRPLNDPQETILSNEPFQGGCAGEEPGGNTTGGYESGRAYSLNPARTSPW